MVCVIATDAFFVDVDCFKVCVIATDVCFVRCVANRARERTVRSMIVYSYLEHKQPRNQLWRVVAFSNHTARENEKNRDHIIMKYEYGN